MSTNLSTKTLHAKFPENTILIRFQPLTGGANVGYWGGAICSTAGEIAPPVNMLDEALQRRPCVSQRRPAVYLQKSPAVCRGGPSYTYTSTYLQRRSAMHRGGPLCTEEARCAQRRPAVHRAGPHYTEEARRVQRRPSVT